MSFVTIQLSLQYTCKHLKKLISHARHQLKKENTGLSENYNYFTVIKMEIKYLGL